jgi:uncharacterized protein YlxW (UPF0749 family)
LGRAKRARRTGRWRREAASVGLVAVLAGLLFTLNARAAQGSDLRDAPGLRGMLAARDREVRALERTNAAVAEQLAELLDRATGPRPPQDEAAALAAGAVDVTGPGLTVTLDDSKTQIDVLADSAANPSDRLVHQQDVDAVMNALKAGGAEAITVQGHRIASNTVVKCVGNVILVAGRVYSPPYQIAAIGPAAEMRAALETAPLVRAYRERASRLDLTWSVQDNNNLTLAGDPVAATRLTYAHVPDQPSQEGTP